MLHCVIYYIANTFSVCKPLGDLFTLQKDKTFSSFHFQKIQKSKGHLTPNCSLIVFQSLFVCNQHSLAKLTIFWINSN